MQWTPNLLFVDEGLLERSKELVRRAKNQLTLRQKWLGIHFHREIQEGFVPEVSIEWINERIGFGVFARCSFPAGAYLGEYTGLVRPRKRKLDRKNDYCFEYPIGRKSPWVIDAKEHGNHARFINHGSRPNIEPIAVCSIDGLIHLIFLALQHIPEGTQLLYEYGIDFWKKRKNLLHDF